MLDLISILFQATVFLREYKERLTTTLNYTYRNLEIACNKLSTVKLACSRRRNSGEKSFSKKKCGKRVGAGERPPFPKSRASYFRFARFNTSALYYQRAWHRLL